MTRHAGTRVAARSGRAAALALLDPYPRLGPLYFVDVSGRLQYLPTYQVSRLGFEGVLGLNFAWRHVAIGPELRYGRTNEAWFMLGFHIEARF